tara:strand:+ start:246 stop:404 length:159 start_codon:yes stop_codon:yes gene_type:complete
MELDIYDIIYQDDKGNFYTFKGNFSDFPSVYLDDEDIEKINDLKNYFRKEQK